MGDGPAYDYMYDQMAQSAAHKRKTQKKRVKMLHGILQEIGFGESDGELSILEEEAAKHLELAYELFSELSRRGK